MEIDFYWVAEDNPTSREPTPADDAALAEHGPDDGDGIGDGDGADGGSGGGGNSASASEGFHPSARISSKRSAGKQASSGHGGGSNSNRKGSSSNGANEEEKVDAGPAFHFGANSRKMKKEKAAAAAKASSSSGGGGFFSSLFGSSKKKDLASSAGAGAASSAKKKPLSPPTITSSISGASKGTPNGRHGTGDDEEEDGLALPKSPARDGPIDEATSVRIIDLLASSARVARLRRPDQSTMVLQSLGLQIAPDDASGLCRVCGLQEDKPAYESHQILMEDVVLEINGLAVMHLTFDRIMMTLAKAGTEVTIKVATDWDVRRAQDLHNASPAMLVKPQPVHRLPGQRMYSGSFWGGDEPDTLGSSLNSSFGKSANMLPKRAGTLDTSADGDDDVFNISGITPLDKSTLEDGAAAAAASAAAAKSDGRLEPIMSIPDMRRDGAGGGGGGSGDGDGENVGANASDLMSPMLKGLAGITLRGDVDDVGNSEGGTTTATATATEGSPPPSTPAYSPATAAAMASTPDDAASAAGGGNGSSVATPMSDGKGGAPADTDVDGTPEAATTAAAAAAEVEAPAQDYGFYVKLPPKRKKAGGANKTKMTPKDAAAAAVKKAKAAELTDPSINLELESGDLDATRKLTRDFLSMGSARSGPPPPPPGLGTASAPAPPSQSSSSRERSSRPGSVTSLISSSAAAAASGDADAGSDGDSLVSTTLSSTAPSGLRGGLGELPTPARGQPAGLFSAARPAGLRTPSDAEALARKQAKKAALQEKVMLAASASQESFGSGGSAMTEVADFLRANRLGEYIPIFEEEDIDFETLMEINETDLEKIGVTKLGARRKIMRAIVQLEPSDSVSRARSSMAGSDTSSVRSSPTMGRRWRSAFQPIDHHRSNIQPDGVYRLAASTGLVGGGSVSSVSGSEASSRM